MDENADSSQPEPTVLKAQAFQLVDSAGQVRGSLALDHNADPYIALRDRQGNKRLVLRIGADGNPDINLFDQDHQVRAMIGLDHEGSPDFAFWDANGQSRVILRLGEEGEPRLWFYEAGSEDPRLGLMVDKKGQAAVELYGRYMDAGVTLFVNEDGESGLNFFDGETREPRINLRVSRDGQGRIRLRDENGSVIWSAPDSPTPEPEETDASTS